MPVIWGLDLREIDYRKFKSSYMWSNTYHLRRTKFIVYQLAMIFCVVSESLGTAALSDYVDQQEDFRKASDGQYGEYNDDFVGIGSYNIFTGVYVATIFGSGFFFDLFWPERYEPKWVRNAWKIAAIFACLFALGAAIGLTVIVSSHCAYVSGADGETLERLIAVDTKTPLCYYHNGRAIASLVFIWPGLLATIASTIVMWKSQNHDDLIGPLSTSARLGHSQKTGVPGSQFETGAVEPKVLETTQPTPAAAAAQTAYAEPRV